MAQIRRDFLNEIANMGSTIYEVLLDAKSVDEKNELFRRVDEIIFGLQNMYGPADNNGIRTRYNGIRDTRKATNDKFIDLAMSMDSIKDPAFLKALHVGIAFENSNLVKLTEEYIALNPDINLTEEDIAKTFAESFHVTPELAQCYLSERAVRTNLKSNSKNMK